jgi:hypothetical protein
MVLAFQTITKKIPEESTGPQEFDMEAKFETKVIEKRADVAIKAFKFDQKDNLQLIDIVQVSAGNVSVINDVVKFKINCEFKRKTTARYTGHVNVLVIADVEPVPTSHASTGTTTSGTTTSG